MSVQRLKTEFVDGDGLTWKLAGTIGVDSGGIVVTDPCYVKDMFLDWEKHCDEYAKWNNNFEDRICQDPRKMMLFSSAGFGDGEYAIYARYLDEGAWGVRVAELRVVFIAEDGVHKEEDDEDRCEECGWRESECSCAEMEEESEEDENDSPI